MRDDYQNGSLAHKPLNKCLTTSRSIMTVVPKAKWNHWKNLISTIKMDPWHINCSMIGHHCPLVSVPSSNQKIIHHTQASQKGRKRSLSSIQPALPSLVLTSVSILTSMVLKWLPKAAVVRESREQAPHGIRSLFINKTPIVQQRWKL